MQGAGILSREPRPLNIWRIRAWVLLLCLAGLAALRVAPAEASVKCAKRHGVLRIYPYANPRIDLDFAGATVRRVGHRIEVFDIDRVDCRGRQATIQNTRRIVFRQVGLSFAEVDLHGGLLRKPSGRPVKVTFLARPGALGYGIFKPLEGDQNWVVYPAGRRVGIRLGRATGAPDAVYRGAGDQVLSVQLGDGDDRIDASGLPRVRGRRFLVIAEGMMGADRLFGSFGVDFLTGGPGGDRVLGFGERDTIWGGSNRDLLGGGGGRDRIGAHDGARDVANCGPAADRARLDHGDVVRSCESRRYGEYVEPDMPPPPWAQRIVIR